MKKLLYLHAYAYYSYNNKHKYCTLSAYLSAAAVDDFERFTLHDDHKKKFYSIYCSSLTVLICKFLWKLYDQIDIYKRKYTEDFSSIALDIQQNV